MIYFLFKIFKKNFNTIKKHNIQIVKIIILINILLYIYMYSYFNNFIYTTIII